MMLPCLQGHQTTRLTAVTASAETPVNARSPSAASLNPSGTEKRHRSVAASPTRFFELLVRSLINLCFAGTRAHDQACLLRPELVPSSMQTNIISFRPAHAACASVF